MPVPTMHFEHALDALKGPAYTEWQLSYTSKLAASVTVNPVYEGRCVSLDSAGKFVLGATGTAMPIFLFKSSDAFDVANPGGTYWKSIRPSGEMAGFVATGAFELLTSEYAAGTYNPNDILHAPTEGEITGADKSAAGRLYKLKGWPGGADAALVLYKDHVCGVVSRGIIRDMNKINRLAFWPVYLPGNPSLTTTP